MGGKSLLVGGFGGGGSPLSDVLTDDDYIYNDTFSRRFVAQRNASKFTTTVETSSKQKSDDRPPWFGLSVSDA